MLIGSVQKETMGRRAVFLITRMLLWTGYPIFMEMGFDYLFPFFQIKRGSRIVIYGAGTFGLELVNAISSSSDYDLVMWVDRQGKQLMSNPSPKIKVSRISEMLERQAEYDYVAIAIIDYDIANKAKESLVSMGIEEAKIALMDPGVVTEENLPRMIRDNVSQDVLKGS